VTLSKEEYDKIARDAARARANQSKADRYDAIARGGAHFKTPAPAEPPTQEELDARAAAEDRKASAGLMQVAADPAFRAALDADPTLRDMLLKNPLAVLPMLAPEALDADDAIALVKEALVARTPKPPTPATPPATPPTPPAGGVNPDSTQVDAEYEAARKIPNTESAIANMVKVGIKKLNR
jgi:hypothetical protein